MSEHYSTDGAICPHCETVADPADDNYPLYSEETCEWECGQCGNTFSVSVYVSHSWTTKISEDHPMTTPDTSRESVARWAPVGYDTGMSAMRDGPFVEYADYAALRDQLDAAEEQSRGLTGDIEWLETENKALQAERDAALALVGAAYEAAVVPVKEWMCDTVPLTAEKVTQEIRALTPADALDALDQIKREARAEGMREAMRIILDRIDPENKRGRLQARTILERAAAEIFARAAEIEKGEGHD
ncbi:MAG: hypothetical protein M0R28_20410 [Pigmentiphaga sp.]|nr:hypothetical protein [Pigmentiphaga sp.]